MGRVYPPLGFAKTPFHPLRSFGSRGHGPRGASGGLSLGAALAMIALLALSLPAAADTQVYRYEDSRGVVHFTNVAPDDRFEKVKVFQSRRRTRTPRKPMRAYDSLIRTAAQRQGIPPALVKAVIHAESAFNPKAVSRAGAMGLMQLMPATAAGLGVDAPFRADDNIQGGSRYLRMMHDKYGSWTFALAAYNAGPKAVDKYQGVPPYRETREYVRRVLTYYRRYHGDFAQ